MKVGDIVIHKQSGKKTTVSKVCEDITVRRTQTSYFTLEGWPPNQVFKDKDIIIPDQEKMKVGDLIKVPDCWLDDECFFCHSKSSRIGILLRFTSNDWAGGRWWKAKFDVGEWEICEREFELYYDIYEQLEVTLNESR